MNIQRLRKELALERVSRVGDRLNRVETLRIAAKLVATLLESDLICDHLGRPDTRTMLCICLSQV